jgi:hypothetical protein
MKHGYFVTFPSLALSTLVVTIYTICSDMLKLCFVNAECIFVFCAIFPESSRFLAEER